MSIPVQLRDSVRLLGAGGLLNGFAFESRAGGARRALLKNGTELEVFDLDELFTGERAPSVVFPMPWPGWDWGVHSVSPDGTFAVFSGQREVRAVAADGRTLWQYRHGCWDQEIGHLHTGDEQQVCRGSEHGSCRVSDDGRLVWAHVVDPETEYDELWVVLDARDGRELARLPLDSVTSGSHHLSHPDGVHMALDIGMGQDGILLYWGRWDGEKLTTWDLNETMDRILMDVHQEHAGFLTVEHYGQDMTLHALDGAVLAEGEPPEAEEDEDPTCWDWSCGFVDADTVIGSTTEYDDEGGDPRHWLLDARTLEIRGLLAYPDGPVDGFARPLGDGTWLTYDESTSTLHRWSLAAPPAAS
ncbi:hypothetical protein [Streptomyces solicathayae]|uniref:Uncharacterized protein n=1 Tax=Streptomyces solicathayae TaxID=3081768 RepID=A0ABZ0M0C2_9ACTN|nr:hypothetical protein [Streptomyces sp. HUAS YS2]WOX24494.1 hypothetical protein R2D22_25170 [Streptomyces sp. HUAS YS2]